MSGYSGTPLVKKLGIQSGMRLLLEGEPENYLSLVGPLPADVTVHSRGSGKLDMVHPFAGPSPRHDS